MTTTTGENCSKPSVHARSGGNWTRFFEPCRQALTLAARAAVVLAIVLGVAANRAAAQDSSSPGENSGSVPGAGVGAFGEVIIDQVRGSLGAGGRFRPGEMTPMAFTVTDRGTAVRNVLLRLETTDIDGDKTYWSRPITTTPGSPGTVWLYARVPYGSDSYTVSAFAAEAGESDDPSAPEKVVYTPGRRLGAAVFDVRNTVESTAAMMLIVGTGRAGLDSYTWRLGAQNAPPALSHEPIELFPIKPAELPDRALGLRGYEVIVWTGSGADEQPAKLSVQQAEAIREWIAGGGHLVIVLPTVGQTWLESIANPLADVMPEVSVERRDNVDLALFRTMLTRRDPMKEGQVTRRIVLPSSTVVHTFSPLASAGPYGAIPILDSPAVTGTSGAGGSGAGGGSGGAVVIRRLYNAGAVTVVGLDLNHPALTGDSLRADFFWHRVLGRRGEHVKTGSPDVDPTKIPSSREPVMMIDGVIDANIQREAKSAGGLLLALIVFGAFWIVACPMSFFVLKNRKLTHHAWLAFAGAIGVFTAISWTGASLLRQRTPDAKFIAIIDHVYGQPMQRARVWANLFLPEYGTQRVSVSESVSKEAKWRPTLVPWEPNESGVSSPFPDVRGYTVESRGPESIAFPTRSTEKRVQVDWVGPPKWSMPLPQTDGETGAAVFGSEIRVERTVREAGGVSYTVRGALKHGLPAVLEGVQVVLVTGQSPLKSTNPTGELLATARVWTLKDPWPAGETLSLDFINQSKPEESTALDARLYLDSLVPMARTGFIGSSQDEIKGEMRTDIAKYLNRITYYGVLPVTIAFDALAPRASVVQRDSTHHFDLARWFTQPCVIVTGHIRRGESPVPIRVDGEEIPTQGHTMVRWIYPLPANPPEYQAPEPTE